MIFRYKNRWLSGRDPGLAGLAQNQHPLGWEKPWFRRFFGSHFQRFEHITIFQPEKHLGPSYEYPVFPHFRSSRNIKKERGRRRRRSSTPRTRCPDWMVINYQCIFIGISMGFRIFMGDPNSWLPPASSASRARLTPWLSDFLPTKPSRWPPKIMEFWRRIPAKMSFFWLRSACFKSILVFYVPCQSHLSTFSVTFFIIFPYLNDHYS